MLEDFVGVLAKAVDRRVFLSKTAWATTTLMATLLGFPQAASATCKQVQCCCLCKKTTDCTLAACKYTWYCPIYRGDFCSCASCTECYANVGAWCTTDGNCTGAIGSFMGSAGRGTCGC
jgi:hypothetical protein